MPDHQFHGSAYPSLVHAHDQFDCIIRLLCLGDVRPYWKRHQSPTKAALMRCFLYIFEGAGTIRTVGAIFHFLGIGTTFCQQVFGRCAAQCVFSFVRRLIQVRLLTVVLQWHLRQKAWNMYQSQMVGSILFSISVMILFFVVEEPEKLLDSILLAERGNRSFAILLAVSLFFTTVIYPDAPELVKLVKVAHDKAAVTPASEKFSLGRKTRSVVCSVGRAPREWSVVFREDYIGVHLLFLVALLDRFLFRKSR